MKFTLSMALAALFITQPISVYVVAANSTASKLADDPVPTPTAIPGEELERAKRETALAEEREREREKKAEAEQAELEAQLALPQIISVI